MAKKRKDNRLWINPTEGQLILIETAATGKIMKPAAWLLQVAVLSAGEQLNAVRASMQDQAFKKPARKSTK